MLKKSCLGLIPECVMPGKHYVTVLGEQVMRSIVCAMLYLGAMAMLNCRAEELKPENTMTIKPLSRQQLATKAVRVASVQITGNWRWGHPAETNEDAADLAIPLIEKAAGDQVDLICFPELYLGMFRVPSAQTEKIAKAARKYKINVTIGCFEVLDAAGNYMNATLVFDREGAIIGRYFKAFQAVGDPNNGWPPMEDDPEWMMQPGNEFPVFDLDFGRIGILTCYDGYFPEVWRILALKGAEVILWPNARGGNIEDFICRTAVHQNYVHVVTTNKAVGGGTMVVAWPNVIVAQAEPEKETMITAQLEMEPLRAARTHAREFFQRRPAIFGELIKEFPVWQAYTSAPPPGLNPPAPSQAARERILRSAGIEFKKP